MPAFVVFTDATLQLIAEQRADVRRRPCCASAASARPSSSATATPLLGARRLRRSSRNFLQKYPAKSFAAYDARPVAFSSSTDHAHHDPGKVRARSTEGGGPHDQQHPHDDGSEPVVFGMSAYGRPPSRAAAASPLSPALRCRRAPASASSATWASRPRATSRGPLPGDHRPVDTQQPSAASRPRNPTPGSAAFLFLQQSDHPRPATAIRSTQGGDRHDHHCSRPPGPDRRHAACDARRAPRRGRPGDATSCCRAESTTRSCGSPSRPPTSSSPRRCARTARSGPSASPELWSGVSPGASGAESCSSKEW